ncbi:MAG: ABC transporter permease [Phycisphaerae bacterium]
MTTAAPPPSPTLSYTTPAPPARRQLPIFFWALVALALLLAYNALFTPSMFKIHITDGRLYGSMIDVLHRATPVVLLSLGMTFVIATGGIDLSVGSIMAMSAGLSALLLTANDVVTGNPITPHSAFLATLSGLAIGLLAGIWNGALVSFLRVQPIIATLILMIAGRGIAQLITHGQIPTFHSRPFEFLSNGTFLWLPFTITIAVAMTAIAALFTRRTALGLFLESIGNNAKAADIAGIPTRFVTLMAYAFTGLCAGIAGVLAASDIRAGDVMKTGINIELDAIVAVAIGGTSLIGGRFSITGSILGAITMQLLKTTIIASNVSPYYNLVIEAAVVVLICLLQSPKTRSTLKRLLKKRSTA